MTRADHERFDMFVADQPPRIDEIGTHVVGLKPRDSRRRWFPGCRPRPAFRARRVIELYWPQSTPYGGTRETAVLAQNQGGQAEIVSAIRRFRDRFSADPSESLSRVRLRDPARYERLLATVEWKLIEMPLPRLQLVGERKTEFLYRIGWDERVRLEETRKASFDAVFTSSRAWPRTSYAFRVSCGP